MGCPHPLDPLCVAIMLRLSSGSETEETIAAELEVPTEIVRGRLQRLALIGAVSPQANGDRVSLLPEAHRIILEIATNGLNQPIKAMSPSEHSSSASRLKRLEQEPLFQGLPTAELACLARVSRSQHLSAGEILILEGDVCRGLYIVDQGTIRLSKASTSTLGLGREQTIRLMVAGDSFNEVPVFDGGPNPVTAEVLDDATVILVPKQEVLDMVDRCPEFASIIIKIMAQRLRHMVAMIEDVSMRDVTGRVAKILLQFQRPSDGVGAGLRTGRRLTQREIAEMAGTAREVVARALKKMELTGAVAVRRGNVQILDPELLESLT